MIAESRDRETVDTYHATAKGLKCNSLTEYYYSDVTQILHLSRVDGVDPSHSQALNDMPTYRMRVRATCMYVCHVWYYSVK